MPPRRTAQRRTRADRRAGATTSLALVLPVTPVATTLAMVVGPTQTRFWRGSTLPPAQVAAAVAVTVVAVVLGAPARRRRRQRPRRVARLPWSDQGHGVQWEQAAQVGGDAVAE